MTYSQPTSTARAVLRALLLGLACLATQAQALTLPAVISDGMVVQRGVPVRVWGTSQPSERIDVDLAGVTASTRAGPDGLWLVELPPMTRANSELRVTSSSGGALTVRNVTLGQVWLCGGQSNMAMALHRTDGAAWAEAPRLGATVRLFRAAGGAARLPQETWLEDSADNAVQFSAICYMVGRALAQQLNEPVGLIDTSIGATQLEAWHPSVNDAKFAQPFERKRRNIPGYSFQKVLRPIAPYGVAGLIWYQGETDAAREYSTYGDRLAKALTEWRDVFRQPSMPIFIVQLPNFLQAKNPVGWMSVQHQQLELPNMAKGVYTVRTDDLTFETLHPSAKHEISRRLVERLIR